MYHIAYTTPSRQLVEVFTPSRFNAVAIWGALALTGRKVRLFKVGKGSCQIVA